MHITPDSVGDEHAWVRERAPVIVPILNDARDRLGTLFETEVDPVSREMYHREVDVVFADGEVAVNVAGYVGLLRDLDVEGDYPGFVVDEVLGRELAATIAGGRPLSLLAQATFHFVDVHVDEDATERRLGCRARRRLSDAAAGVALARGEEPVCCVIRLR